MEKCHEFTLFTAFASILPPVSGGQWWIEHLGAMIGSGIGAYTAFLTFGARQLLAGTGYWQLLFWVAPGVIGALVIGHLSRKYHLQFQGK